METAPDPAQPTGWPSTDSPAATPAATSARAGSIPLRLLAALLAETDADIAALTGGSAMNAIPSEAAAVVVP